MSHGGKNLTALGPPQKRPPTHGRLLELSQHKSFCNFKTKHLYAIFPALQNRKTPCTPCVPPPTFSHVKTCHQWCLNLNQSSQTPLPAHARLLSTPKRGYVASAKESNDNQVTVGVHFSPEEFLSEAIRLCHPTEHNCLFPKEVRANVAHLSDKSVHQIALERTEEVKRWVALSKELSTKERDLKSSISPRIAEVLKDKKLCLLKQLLDEAGHEDTGLVEDIKRGFDLTGALPRSSDPQV